MDRNIQGTYTYDIPITFFLVGLTNEGSFDRRLVIESIGEEKEEERPENPIIFKEEEREEENF